MNTNALRKSTATKGATKVAKITGGTKKGALAHPEAIRAAYDRISGGAITKVEQDVTSWQAMTDEYRVVTTKTAAEVAQVALDVHLIYSVGILPDGSHATWRAIATFGGTNVNTATCYGRVGAILAGMPKGKTVDPIALRTVVNAGASKTGAAALAASAVGKADPISILSGHAAEAKKAKAAKKGADKKSTDEAPRTEQQTVALVKKEQATISTLSGRITAAHPLAASILTTLKEQGSDPTKVTDDDVTRILRSFGPLVKMAGSLKAQRDEAKAKADAEAKGGAVTVS